MNLDVLKVKIKESEKAGSHQESNVAMKPGAKPGKKFTLNKQYALLSQLRLLTRVTVTIEALLSTKYDTEHGGT